MEGDWEKQKGMGVDSRVQLFGEVYLIVCVIKFY